MTQSFYKSLKFINFIRGKASGPTFRLERLEPPSGGLVGELQKRRSQLLGRGSRPGNDLFASEEPGVALLRELLDDLRAQPAQIPAQVIQRWAGHKDGETLQKLLGREEVITGAAAAAEELRAALLKLADQAAGRRLEALEAKSRSGSLAADEIDEFQRLIERLSHRDARGG